MTEKQIKVSVNSLLINSEGQVLLGKRLKNAGIGSWGLPGGHLEFAESPTAGVIRELFEETGLVAEEVIFSSVVSKYTNLDGENHYIHLNFLVTKFLGELENKEPKTHEVWQWFELDALPEQIFYAHQPFLTTWKNNRVFIEEGLEK